MKELYISGAPHVNYFVDITSTMDKKIEALMCHQSQFIGRTAELEKMMRFRVAELGKKYWVEYAEEFHRTENR